MTKEKKQINMEPTDEFRDFGKKMPYQEPAGFFEHLSEKTLQQAKLREQTRRKTVILWRTIAAAASLSAVALFGYYRFEPEKPVINPIANERQSVDKQLNQNLEAEKQPEVAEMKKIVPEVVPENIIGEGNGTEEITDVLAELSDEELFQLAAMYKADVFISESEQ